MTIHPKRVMGSWGETRYTFQVGEKQGTPYKSSIYHTVDQEMKILNRKSFTQEMEAYNFIKGYMWVFLKR